MHNNGEYVYIYSQITSQVHTHPLAVIVCTNNGISAQQHAAAEAAFIEDNTIRAPESNAPKNVSCLATFE